MLNVISASLRSNTFFCNVCKRWSGAELGIRSGAAQGSRTALTQGCPRPTRHTWTREGPLLLATYLTDPAEAEVALQNEVKFILDAQGGDVTAEVQAVSNGAVLGTEK